jgi:ATP-binding cassette subfamily B (MDR/TAP) protein 1
LTSRPPTLPILPSPGGLLQGLNEDSLAVQQAISDKMGIFLQHMSTFLVGYIIAFWRGWDVTLVMVGCLPFLAGSGALLAKVTTSLGNKSAEAYTMAGSVVQQNLAQIRTVSAYNGQQRAVTDYDSKLDMPTQVRHGGSGGYHQVPCT